MAEIALKGNMKVKTLKSEFKKAFGCSLRVYKSESCKGRYAEDDVTLASIRADGKKGGELAIKGNMKVGNFEKKIAEMYGIGVQVANADDSALADDAATLSSMALASAPKEKKNESHKEKKVEVPQKEKAEAPKKEKIEKKSKKSNLSPEQFMAILCRVVYEKEKLIEKNLGEVQKVMQELILCTKGIDGQKCLAWFNNREWTLQHLSFMEVCDYAKGDPNNEELVIYSIMRLGAPHGTSQFTASFVFAACAVFGIQLEDGFLNNNDKLSRYLSDIFGGGNAISLRALLNKALKQLVWGDIAQTLGRDDLIKFFDELESQGYGFYTDYVTKFNDKTNWDEIMDGIHMNEWQLVKQKDWSKIKAGFILVHYYYSKWIAKQEGVIVYASNME